MQPGSMCQIVCAAGTVPRIWHSAMAPIFISSFTSKVEQIGACVGRACVVKVQYMCVCTCVEAKG